MGATSAVEGSRQKGARRLGRPTKAESVRLRDRLLKIATEEFLANGYAGARLDHIAARARIGRMTVYRHFPSKDRLFRAVVQHVGERFRTDLAEIALDGRPVRQVLTDFAFACYDDPASEQILGITRIVIAEAGNFPDLAYTIYQQRREMIQPLTEYLRRQRDGGALRFGGDPELVAFQFVAMASGGIRALMIPREAIERGRQYWAEAAVDIFLDGTLAPAAT